MMDREEEARLLQRIAQLSGAINSSTQPAGARFPPARQQQRRPHRHHHNPQYGSHHQRGAPPLPPPRVKNRIYVRPQDAPAPVAAAMIPVAPADVTHKTVLSTSFVRSSAPPPPKSKRVPKKRQHRAPARVPGEHRVAVFVDSVSYRKTAPNVLLRSEAVKNKTLKVPREKKRPKQKPVCSFFLRGECNRDDCPYSHVNVNPFAEGVLCYIVVVVVVDVDVFPYSVFRLPRRLLSPGGQVHFEACARVRLHGRALPTGRQLPPEASRAQNETC